MARDRVVSNHIFQTARYDGHFIDPVYIESETGLALAVDGGEFKATVANPILSVPLNDSGVVRVRLYDGGDFIRALKVDMFDLENIKKMEFTAPSSTNPVVYRTGQVLHFVGLASGSQGTHTAYIDYVEAMVGGNTDYSVSEAHVMEITDLAVEIGEKELGVKIIDEINDGSQNK